MFVVPKSVEYTKGILNHSEIRKLFKLPIAAKTAHGWTTKQLEKTRDLFMLTSLLLSFFVFWTCFCNIVCVCVWLLRCHWKLASVSRPVQQPGPNALPSPHCRRPTEAPQAPTKRNHRRTNVVERQSRNLPKPTQAGAKCANVWAITFRTS